MDKLLIKIPELSLDPTLVVYCFLCFEHFIKRSTTDTTNKIKIIKNKEPPIAPPMTAPAVLDLEEPGNQR